MPIIGRRVLRYGRVGSTMAVAAASAAAGEAEGLVVVADEQTAGRGRAGRAWQAPAGSSLLLSVLLRPRVPSDRLGVLAPLAGVALAEAVETETGLRCWLKWPNDLWLGDRNAGVKAAGILAAARLDGDHPDHVLLGIGLNVTTEAKHLPPGATSLALALALGGSTAMLPPPPGPPGSTGSDPDSGHEASPAKPRGHSVPMFAEHDQVRHTPDRERLLSAILERLDAHYREFVASNGRPTLDGWRARAALLGEMVSVAVAGRDIDGTLVGIDDDGALRLRLHDGRVERIVAGDLTRGPRRAAPA